MTNTLAPEQQDRLEDTIEAQRELVYIELAYRRRQLLADPGLVRLIIGAGRDALNEHTLRGDPRDPYNGVAIFNPTSATLSVGFQAGTGLLAPTTVPPFSFICLPERYVNLSVALLNPADQQQTYASPVTVLRLRVPPHPDAGPYGNPATEGPALAAANPGSAALIGAAGAASVVAANPARRELTIVNAGATGWVTLGLGSAIPAMWAGIPLAPNGGAYSTSEYDGPVSMIAAANNTLVSIAEV